MVLVTPKEVTSKGKGKGKGGKGKGGKGKRKHEGETAGVAPPPPRTFSERSRPGSRKFRANDALFHFYVPL